MDITLENIAGYEEEKNEVRKLINVFINYKKYESIGVYIPKGLIFQGPPGCGKTLFAKAFASEAHVPFYEFVADDDSKTTLKKLQNTFKEAKKHKPAIVYIDEIDKLTNTRFFDSDAVRTLTQYILTELDGLSTTDGLMILASTNFYEQLPASLCRSGRMDKKIKIDYPELDSRIQILKYYIKDNEIFKNVNIKSLALKIKGMTGADIKTLINNALIEYVDGNEKVTTDSFVELINEMNFETIGKRWNNKEVVTKVLIHEAGHAIMNLYTTKSFSSISGIKYDSVAGFTRVEDWACPEDEIVDEDEAITYKQAYNNILSAFGGMIAEKEFYGEFDNGNSSDLSKILNIFNYMADSCFFGPRYLLIDYERCVDVKTVAKLLKIRTKLLSKAQRKAKKIIHNARYLIRYVVDEAKKHEDTLNEMQFKNIVMFYIDHKKELDLYYKKHKLIDNDKNNRKDTN